MSRNILQQSQILIVDDEIANVRFLEMILEDAGYVNISSTTDSHQALRLFRDVHPDLVLLDLNMPGLDGFAVMRQLQPEMGTHPVPILVLTADSTSASKHLALKEGAQDFLTKPLDQTEVLLRIENLLETRFRSALLEARVHERTLALEKRTHDWEMRTLELEQAQLETLQRLAMAAEYRDDDTGLHTQRVGLIAEKLAMELGLPESEVNLLRLAAPLHDVGKIGITDAILLKPAKLTLAEFVIMRTHTVIGANLLAGSRSPWLQLAETIALTHHERFDGKGYPNKISGEDIPLVGRIVAIADVFDALTHERPYKEAWSIAAAITEIESKSGSQFDDNVVTAFMELSHESLV